MDQATKILDLCKKVGFKTAFELKEYKQDHNCKSNDDTIRALTETLGRIEKREKAIEEITTLLCSEKACSQEYCKNAQKDKQRYCCLTLNGVERLYDAGYRKEEEVQKETAKNIYCELYKISFIDENGMMHPTFENWVNVLKRFGVEVEE